MTAPNEQPHPVIRIIVEVPLHRHYPNYFADEQRDLIKQAVEEAMTALRGASMEAIG